MYGLIAVHVFEAGGSVADTDEFRLGHPFGSTCYLRWSVHPNSLNLLSYSGGMLPNSPNPPARILTSLPSVESGGPIAGGLANLCWLQSFIISLHLLLFAIGNFASRKLFLWRVSIGPIFSVAQGTASSHRRGIAGAMRRNRHTSI